MVGEPVAGPTDRQLSRELSEEVLPAEVFGS
jgi:hypothetical protein